MSIPSKDSDKNACATPLKHLGHRSFAVRMGGAYRLFHLAKDTKDLRQTVLDVLCAHIRQTTSDQAYRDEYTSRPSVEIQSLLTLLFVQQNDIFSVFALAYKIVS